MRPLAVALATTLVCATVSPAGAQPFSDVPSSHWAYDAIAELSSQGIVQGFPDGTFRGNRAMTRYEMAVIVARLLARIESIQVPAPTPAAPQPVLTPENLQEIQRLVEEFRGELTALGVRVAAVEEELNALKAKQDYVRFTGAFRYRFDDYREPANSPTTLPCSTATSPCINGNPRTFAAGDTAFAILPRDRFVAKLEFDGSVAPDVHLITALLTGSGARGSYGYAVFNSSTVGPTTTDSIGSIDNLFVDWKSMFGWPVEVWLGRFGGSTQIAYGSHPVQFGPFGLLMNTATNTYEDSTLDSGFNVVDGLRIAGHWPDLADLQTQAVYVRVTGGSGSTYFSGEDAFGVDANVRILSGVRLGAYYVGNTITGSPPSFAPHGSDWHLYGPGSGGGIGAPGPNCSAVLSGTASTAGPTPGAGVQCPALGSGWGGYVGWNAMQGIQLDGEYATWQDGVFGTTDNGWQVMANLDLGTLTGWGHSLSLQVGYLDYGPNFYPPYGAADADVLGYMNDTIYPGNAQGILGIFTFSPIENWTIFASYYGGTSVSPNFSESAYAGGVRWLFSPRATLTIYTREASIASQEQYIIYRAQIDYNF
jgi:hypothetical protein